VPILNDGGGHRAGLMPLAIVLHSPGMISKDRWRLTGWVGPDQFDLSQSGGAAGPGGNAFGGPNRAYAS